MNVVCLNEHLYFMQTFLAFLIYLSYRIGKIYFLHPIESIKFTFRGILKFIKVC